MNDTAKKGILIAVIALAAIVVAWQAPRLFAGEQMETVETIPAAPGAKSEKRAALEELERMKAEGKQPATAPIPVEPQPGNDPLAGPVDASVGATPGGSGRN